MPTNLSSGMIPYSSLPEFERSMASQQKLQTGSDMSDIASVDSSNPGVITVDRPNMFTSAVAAHEVMHTIQNKVGGGNQIDVHNLPTSQRAKPYEYTDADLKAGIGTLNVEQQAQIPRNYMDQYPVAVAKGGKAVDTLNAQYARPVQQLGVMAANGMPLTPQPPGAPPAALTGIAVPLPGMMSTSTMSQPVPLTPFQHLAIAAKHITNVVGK